MLAELHFLRPAWFLALVPLAWLLWRLLGPSRRATLWRGQVDAHLLPHLLVGGTSRHRWPILLLAAAWALAVTALAGPAWQRLPEPAHRTAAERVIVLDLSRSMLATDLSPSRLVRARLEVLDLLRAGADGRMALIVFGAEPFLVSPLTSDTATIAAQVASLAPELLPVSGLKRTDMALREARELLARAGVADADVILVTDGLEQPASAFAAADELAASGHRVSLLLVATPAGAPVPAADGGLMTDADGAIRVSVPDEEALRRLVAIGGGRLVALSAEDSDTQKLLGRGPAGGLSTGEATGPQSPRWRDEGPWLLLLLLPLAALAFRRGWLTPGLALCLLLPSADGRALGWSDLWLRADQQAARDLAEGHAAPAAERFTDPRWRAAARYQAGDYEGALTELAGLSGIEADYNRGNALARAGRLTEAMAAYERVLAAAPGHADAAHNLDLVREQLADRQSAMQAAAGSDRGSPAGDQAEEPRPHRPSPQAESAPEEGAASRAQSSAAPQAPAADRDRPARSSSATERSEPGDAGSPNGGEPLSARPVASATADQRPDPSARAVPRAPGQGATDSGLAQGRLKPGAAPGADDLLGLDDPGPRDPARTTTEPVPNGSAEREARQAFEQMLRRVPDDPAGLLRQRFLLQHLRRHGRL